MRTRPTHRPTTAGHGRENSDGHTQRSKAWKPSTPGHAQAAIESCACVHACLCAHPASRSPVLTIMSAICTIFDSLMSPPNAYHDDHLSEGRAVREWTVHRAACLPCPQLLAHMHCVHLTLQHFRKKSIFSRGHQHSTPSQVRLGVWHTPWAAFVPVRHREQGLSGALTTRRW